MTVHSLKTWPEFFREVVSGLKSFEIRKDDRGFEVGDELALEEWDPETRRYTGRLHRVIVLYILRDSRFLPEGVVCMSIVRKEGFR